ncbi:MAG: hypothetical protein ACMVP2_27390 [Imperialibacter sp.]|uniref:hypothetical protein n=1 Tax=Imperialibacter sp. TaxID=2038411 RepID=UPI0030DAF03A
MKKVFLVVSFLMLAGFVNATPSPEKSAKKAYYTSPIREFRGATFYQWKNNDTVKVIKTSTSEDSGKKAVAKTETNTPGKPVASNRTN